MAALVSNSEYVPIIGRNVDGGPIFMWNDLGLEDGGSMSAVPPHGGEDAMISNLAFEKVTRSMR